MTISDEQFEEFLEAALEELPQEYVSRMLPEVAVTYEDEPSHEQRIKQNLKPNETLFGLYEGTPRPHRDPYGFGAPQLPDKITIFKLPIVQACGSEAAVKEQVKKTLWHEMAHYFGLGHKRIHELE